MTSDALRAAGPYPLARAVRRVSLPVVIAATCASLFIGIALHAPCVSGDWSSGVQYRRLCYTDVLPMYEHRGLARGRVPYLEGRNEYPVLIGAFMAVTGLPAGGPGTYFAAAVLGLSAFAIVVAVLLFRLTGWRALLFAAAPTLVVYSFVNWDLIAVAFAVAGTYAFVRRSDRASGALLGLGAAAKLYPVLFVVPFAWSRWREGDRRAAGRLVGGAALSWAVVNAPVAVLAPRAWSYFFRFNAARLADWGSLWATGCRAVTGATVCGASSAVNVGSAIAFAAGAIGVVAVWTRRRLPPWTAAFGLTVVFLLASKVYSPQYSLWLLPWFVLLMPDLRWFVAFELADLTVFVAHLSWQARLEGFGGLPLGALEAASLARAAILVAILVAYARRGPERHRASGEDAAELAAALRPSG
jgi:uncharacterized membrane protein